MISVTRKASGITEEQVKEINKKWCSSKNYVPVTRDSYEEYISKMVKRLSDENVKKLSDYAQYLWVRE